MPVGGGGGGAHKLLNVSLPLFCYCLNKANVFRKYLFTIIVE